MRRRARSAPAPELVGAGVGDATAVEEFLAKRDAREGPVKEGAESRVHWAAGAEGRCCATVILFLHGFSSSPRELDPVDAEVARASGAHLLRFRLTAHGLEPPERAGRELRSRATSAALLHDAMVAWTLAKLLGDRVVLFGFSTGASLSLWLAAQPDVVGTHLGAVILASPAFAINKLGLRTWHLLKDVVTTLPRPAARWLLRTLQGTKTRTIPLVHEQQPRVWTMSYPSDALLSVIEIYVSLEAVDLSSIRVPMLTLANPRDGTVDFKTGQRRLDCIPTHQTDLVEDSEMTHCIMGMLSPSVNDRCALRITDFLAQALNWLKTFDPDIAA